jgi:hypothetical protein
MALEFVSVRVDEFYIAPYHGGMITAVRADGSTLHGSSLIIIKAQSMANELRKVRLVS